MEEPLEVSGHTIMRDVEDERSSGNKGSVSPSSVKNDGLKI